MMLLDFFVGVFTGIAIMAFAFAFAFTSATITKEPRHPPWWLQQRRYYYRRNGRLFYIRATPEQFRRLCERIEEDQT